MLQARYIRSELSHANTCFEVRNFSRATHLYDSIFREFPGYNHAVEDLKKAADAHYLNKNYTRASEVCDSILNRQPNPSIVELKNAARAHYRNANYSRSSELCELVLNREPNPSIVKLQDAARAHYLNKNYTRASELCDSILNRQPNPSIVELKNAARAHYRNANYSRSSELCELVLNREPNPSLKDLANAAVAHFRNANYSRACQLFDSILIGHSDELKGLPFKLRVLRIAAEAQLRLKNLDRFRKISDLIIADQDHTEDDIAGYAAGLMQLEDEEASSEPQPSSHQVTKQENDQSSLSSEVNAQTYKTFVEELDTEKLEAAARVIRGNSQAQQNCTKLSKALIDYLMTGVFPQKSASSHPCTLKDFAVYFNTQKAKPGVKIKIEPGTALPTSEVAYEGIFTGLLPNWEEPANTEGGEIDLTKILIDLTKENTHQDGVDFDEIENRLKDIAKENTHQFSFGIVNLGRRNGPGHMLVYFARPDQVLFVDAQRISRGRGQAISATFDDYRRDLTYIRMAFYIPIDQGYNSWSYVH